MRTINLCGGPNSCCPEIHIGSNGSISITDDYGGIVTLSKDEFIKLQQVKM